MTPSINIPSIDPFVAEISAAPAGPELSVVSVLLVLLVGLTIFLLRVVMQLRDEVAALRAAPVVPASLPATQTATVTPSVAVPAVSAVPTEGPTTEDIIAIAAAVHAFLGPRAEIIGIVPVVAPELQVWSLEGRRQVFQSHRIR